MLAAWQADWCVGQQVAACEVKVGYWLACLLAVCGQDSMIVWLTGAVSTHWVEAAPFSFYGMLASLALCVCMIVWIACGALQC